ncbi:glycosyltransferase family 4 protein [Nocardioides zeicaulis]|uniref:Glycosyltransferase family 4 protein n=1 Tax=Nocardioides zeicaulis TaxID=1776857 RepID=A0ABV6DZT1_9ACTN
MVLTAPTALWVVPVSNLAGVARHVLDVAGAGIPGWQLVFLTPPGDLPQALRERGAAVVEEPFGPDHGTRASVASLRHAVRTLRPAVVHSHLSHADVVAALAVGPRGPRLVTTEHGIARDDLVYHRSAAKARAMAAVHAARLRRFDAVIAVSRATAAAMHDKWHPRTPVTVIPNGVDPVEVATPPRDGLRILSLARLAPEKRLPALVDGFAVLHERHPEARLTLAGTGEEERALRAHVTSRGLDDVVTLPGFADPGAAMAEHDVVAMLSVWENCSYALLDAAARGLGVVASDVGGNPELLPSRCLVDPGDAGAVATALEQQGLARATRPGLVGWPTVADMCERIADVYAPFEARR